MLHLTQLPVVSSRSTTRITQHSTHETTTTATVFDHHPPPPPPPQLLLLSCSRFLLVVCGGGGDVAAWCAPPNSAARGIICLKRGYHAAGTTRTKEPRATPLVFSCSSSTQATHTGIAPHTPPLTLRFEPSVLFDVAGSLCFLVFRDSCWSSSSRAKVSGSDCSCCCCLML